MNNREQLKAFALKINGLLDAYVAIHDERLKAAGSLSSVIKNLFGKSVDFGLLHEKVADLLTEFNERNRELGQLREQLQQSLDDTERSFLDAMSKYFDALHDTCRALSKLTEAQYRRSEGKSPLSWEDNKALEAEYKKLIERYYVMGGRMNELYSQIVL